jgi:voltage-gated potassium channel
MIVTTIFLRIWGAVQHQNLHRVGLAIVLLIVTGSLAFWSFEPEIDLADSFWWAMVTTTTVGYGDISPASPGGRLVGVLLMLVGVGFLGLFTATVASVFVENSMMENRGFHGQNLKDHYVICGWNHEAVVIISELAKDKKSRASAVVVLADLPEKPLADKKVRFVAGEPNAETLEKANLAQARAVIVLSDANLPEEARDAKVVLNVLTIRKLYPEIYISAELMKADNVAHCEWAGCNEAVVLEAMSGRLLVQASLDHGMSKLIGELTGNEGQDLFIIPPPSETDGLCFLDVLNHVKKKHGTMVIGIMRGSDKHLVANPPSEYKLETDDRLVVINAERPDWA